MSTVAQMKLEPPSPFSSADELQWPPDTELYLTTEELEEQLASCGTKGEVLSKMLDLIENLDDASAIPDLDEESLSNYWMEGKSFPLFEEPLPLIKPEEKNTIYDPTQNLLKEFETVFDAVNNGAFTPPQSPPYQAPVLTTLEPPTVYTTLTDHTYQISLIPAEQQKTINFLPPTPQPDVAHELAVVDELVRTRVEHLVPSSPTPSNSSISDSSSSDDPEWSLESSDEYKISPKSTRKRSKPYSQFSEDKKSRKKEQNKNAATRYRMKKKAEVEEILEEEKILQDKNKNLEDNITDLQREIKYLKGLMRDLFKAKGLIQ